MSTRWVLLLSLFAVPAVGAPLVEAFNGYQLLRQNRFEHAEKAFLVGLERRPGSANLRSGLIQSVLGQGRCDDGVAMAWKFRNKKAFNRDVADSIAGCFARDLAFSEAIYWKSAAIRIGRTTPDDYTRLALFHYRKGEDEEATRILEGMEYDSWKPWLTRAIVAVGRGELEQAEHALEMVDLFAEEDIQMRWIVAARLSLDIGDAEQAMLELDRAGSFKSRSPQNLATRAELYRRMGWLRDASGVTLFKGPAYMRDRRWRLTVARVSLDNGNVRQARKLIKAAVETSPTDPEVISTAWYLAQHQGQEELAVKFAAAYAEVQTSPWRTLESLLPAHKPGESR